MQMSLCVCAFQSRRCIPFQMLLLTVTVTFAILARAQSQEQQVSQTAAVGLGGYGKHCKSGSCDGSKSFICNESTGLCECVQHPDSNHVFKFHNILKRCVPIRREDEDAFWECENRFIKYSKNPSDRPLGFCIYHEECQHAHNSTSIGCNFTQCSCEKKECLPMHRETGLQLIGVDQDWNCVYLPINCNESDECVEEYGNYSACNVNTSKCECKQGAKFYEGECECGEDCQPAASTAVSSLASTDESERDSTGSRADSADDPKITPDGHSTTPLIIIACVSTVCVVGLFTLSWVRQRKRSRRVNLRSLRRGQGLDLASSFSTSAFDNELDDDKTGL